MLVSVILPTYNESGNIVGLVNEIIKHIPSTWEYEVIVVDDNSPDGTYPLVRDSFANNPKVRPILRTVDRGFAKSIRAGIEAATGDKVIVMDTDFTHDPVEIPVLLHLSECFDIVSGSRFCAGGRMQSVKHYLASFLYNLVIRLILRTQIQDNLGGFYVIERQKLMKLPFDDIFFGYGEYFFRLLYFAQKDKMTVVEIPANYRSRESGNSKSSFFKMLFTYTGALLQLRLENRRNAK